jgi:hypothetical protein
MRMTVESMPVEPVFLGQLDCVGPVNPGILYFLALGMGTNGTLGLMPAKAGALSLLQDRTAGKAHMNTSPRSEEQSHVP